MKVIGMMSGTSLDGVDLCCVNFFKKDNQYTYKIEVAHMYAYENEWVDILKNAYLKSREEVDAINEKYTLYINKKIRDFIEQFSLHNVDLISSHGHTVWHQPQQGFTLQIGNLPTLKNNIAVPVVCDFRVQDVLLGGQGAPLVPIGDHLLFSRYDFCLNLGGFSNISFAENGIRKAFDICPVNILLNYFSWIKFEKAYDDSGQLASQGQVNNFLLNELNSLNFYNKIEPKSLGIEEVHSLYMPILNKYSISGEDILCTLVEHIGVQIRKIVQKYNGKNILVTGGGAFNDYLVKRIQNHCKEKQLIVPDAMTVSFKEALIFAFLGYLKFHNQINCLSSVTGAIKDHSSGVVYR